MDSIEAVTTWLLKTQDPSGAYGYQGTVAENVNNLVKQTEIKHSMTAAGLGSLYICGNLLGMAGKVEKPPKEEEVPSALKEVKPKNAKPDPSKYKSKIDSKLVREAQERGNGWFAANFKVQVENFNFYYLYALERYKSIAEFCDKNEEKDPQWYSDVAQFLIEKQGQDGTWNSGCGQVPDTAFGVLFLLRSMKKSIAKAFAFGDGTMIGGRGIPKDTSSLLVDRNGQLKPARWKGRRKGSWRPSRTPTAKTSTRRSNGWTSCRRRRSRRCRPSTRRRSANWCPTGNGRPVCGRSARWARRATWTTCPC